MIFELAEVASDTMSLGDGTVLDLGNQALRSGLTGTADVELFFDDDVSADQGLGFETYPLIEDDFLLIGSGSEAKATPSFDPQSNDEEADLGEIVVIGNPGPGGSSGGGGGAGGPPTEPVTDTTGRDGLGESESPPCPTRLQAANPEGGVYRVPPSFSMDQLIAAGNTIADVPLWYWPAGPLIVLSELCGPGQEFDFKSQTSERETYIQADGQIGTRSVYDAIGNCAFGFIAELGGIAFSDVLAWMNEQIDGDGVGEDPLDQEHIRAGIAAAREYKQTGRFPGTTSGGCG